VKKSSEGNEAKKNKHIFFLLIFTNLVRNSIIDLQIFSLTFECEYIFFYVCT